MIKLITFFAFASPRWLKMSNALECGMKIVIENGTSLGTWYT